MESVVVWVTEFIYDGIQEAKTGFIVKVLHDLLKSISRLTMLLKS